MRYYFRDYKNASKKILFFLKLKGMQSYYFFCIFVD